ncbi:MAG: methyltransferase domain-containing protein [Flavobacteriaceae bacterium]
MSEYNAYILGTDQIELHRLGIQHQVWASEAHHGWNLAHFNAGQTLLDLGCGPGFCTKELGYIVGSSGKVIGVDKSEAFIQHLSEIAAKDHLPIEAICIDFNDLQLVPNSLDGMYCRWALAWIPNPEEILKKIYNALKPGGKMVIHEYYDWSTHQIEPNLPHLSKAIKAAYQSFSDMGSNINIGRELPSIFNTLGMPVTHIRTMHKIATVNDLVWQWPKSFYESFFPRLIETGYLQKNDVSFALKDLAVLEKNPGASICCPLMVEVVAEK